MGARAARAVVADLAVPRPVAVGVAPPPLFAVADRRAVQRAMSAGAGIGRDAAGLAAASDAVEAATGVGVARDRAGVEDAALTLLAAAVLAAAGTRTESRGCHVRTDHPDRDDAWQRASLQVTLDADGRPVVAVGCAGGGGVIARSSASPGRRRAPRRSASPTPTTCCASSAPPSPRTCATARTPRPPPPWTADAVAVAAFVLRAGGVLAGVPGGRASVTRRGPGLDDVTTVLTARPDGTRLAAGEPALVVRAPVRGLLTAERTALNLLCHLSGVATATAAWVDAVAGTGARIRDTRKTLPGPAAAGEVRGALRRRRQPPARARRRRADQGQPRGGGRVGRCGAATVPGPRRRTCRARWRSTRSTSSTRCWRWAPSWCCSTTSPSRRPRRRSAAGERADAAGVVRRAGARERPRLRRDGRRVPGGRGAHPLGDGAGRRAGPPGDLTRPPDLRGWDTPGCGFRRPADAITLAPGRLPGGREGAAGDGDGVRTAVRRARDAPRRPPGPVHRAGHPASRAGPLRPRRRGDRRADRGRRGVRQPHRRRGPGARRGAPAERGGGAHGRRAAPARRPPHRRPRRARRDARGRRTAHRRSGAADEAVDAGRARRLLRRRAPDRPAVPAGARRGRGAGHR